MTEVPDSAGENATDSEHLVLVVSDDMRIREELEYGFSSGIAVKIVTDAREAWRLMEEQVPSAVVVDLQTGSAGGFALSKDMHDVQRLADVPILILLDRAQDEWLARQAEPTAIRVKPIEMSRLVADVQSLIQAPA